jgi:hypothetical protein
VDPDERKLEEFIVHVANVFEDDEAAGATKLNKPGRRTMFELLVLDTSHRPSVATVVDEVDVEQLLVG